MSFRLWPMLRDITRDYKEGFCPFLKGFYCIAEGLGWGGSTPNRQTQLSTKTHFLVNSQKTGRYRAEYLHLNRMQTDSFDSKHQMKFFSKV